MSAFTGDLDMRAVGGGFLLLSALVYDIGEEGSGYTVTVPEGTWSDLASIPKPLRWIVSPLDGGMRRPAIVHDYLYKEGFLSRRLADAIMLEAMAVRGVPGWKRWAVYLALRLGGWWAWRGHRRA